MKKIIIYLLLCLSVTSLFSQENEYESDQINAGVGWDALESLATSLAFMGSDYMVVSFPLDFQQSLGTLGYGIGVNPIYMMNIGYNSTDSGLGFEIKVGPHLYFSNNGIDGFFLKARGIVATFPPFLGLEPMYGFEGMAGFNFLPKSPMGPTMLYGPELGFQTLVGGETKVKVGFKMGYGF